MTAAIDPEGVELRALLDAAEFSDARVLEVGCGSGRLARQYATKPRSVVGIDPDRGELTSAAASVPTVAPERVRFLQANAAMLPFLAGRFDIVLFGWSL